MNRFALSLIVLLGVACKASEPKERAAKAEVAASAPALPTGALGPVVLENLGLVLDAPAGAIASTDEQMKDRYAHVEVGMINVFAVDEHSAPSFAKAREVDAGNKLIRDIRGEQTADGWIDVSEIEREHDKARRIEVGVRRTLGTQKWDCGAAALSEDLAKMVLAACQSLRISGSSDWAVGLGGSASTGKGSADVASKPRASTGAGEPAKRSAPPRSSLEKTIARNMGRIRLCYSRAILAKPGLAGTVTVKYVIAASGEVESATAGGINEPSLVACVEKAFASMVFPAPANGKKLTGSYPFVFKST